jgi:hypothetical protein
MHPKSTALTYLATEAILLDFATDTGSNHTGMLDSAATENIQMKIKLRNNKDKTKVEN